MKKLLPLIFLLTGPQIFGSDKAGKIGSEFSYGATIGSLQSASGAPPYTGVPGLSLWYHFSDRFALTLRTGFYSTNYEAVNAPSTPYESRSKNAISSFGASIELPIYIAKLNIVEVYIAPAFGYSFSINSAKSTFASSPNNTIESKYLTEFYSGFGVVGLQVPVLDQLQIIGRTTFGYIYGDTNQDLLYQSNSYAKIAYFGFQSWSLGAIIYFN
jgi:hypothetical protein